MIKRMAYAVVFLSIWFSAGLCFGAVSSYDHKIEVEKMTLEWKLDGQQIHVRLTAKTTGWVGIGFNPSTEMKDANFILGYVKKGKVKVTDHFGTSKRQHDKDKKLGGKRNVTNIDGSESKNMTEVAFTIPLNSGDAKDQVIDPEKETKVLLAYGSGRDSFRAKHQFKAALSVNLKTGQFKRVK